MHPPFELVTLVSVSGDLLEVNRSALDAVQAQRSDLIGKPLWQLPWWSSFSNVNQIEAAVVQAAAGKAVEIDLTPLDARAETGLFSLKITPVQSDPVTVLMLEGHFAAPALYPVDQSSLPSPAALSATPSVNSPDPNQLADILNTAVANVGRFRIYANGDREYLYFSAGSEKVFGHTAEELMADQPLWLARVHPADREAILMPLNQRYFVDCLEPVEYRFYHKDDSLRWVASLYTSRAESKDSWLVTVVSTDITVRKEAEIALRLKIAQDQMLTEISQSIRQSLNLEEVLRQTVERVREYLQTDRVLIFQFASDWTGKTVMESVDPTWNSLQSQEINDPCFRERFIEPYRRGRVSTLNDARSDHLPPCYAEFLEGLQVKADVVVPILQGEQLWGLLIVHHCQSPREWLPQEVELLQQLSTQLSIAIQQSELYQQVRLELLDRTQTQEALLASEARFRALSESAPIGIFQTDPAGNCTYTNPHWQSLTGLTLAESLDQGWWSALHPQDRDAVTAKWISAIESCRGFADEFRFVSTQGEVRWVSAHAGRMQTVAGDCLGYVGTNQDITERKEAESTLQRLNQGLKFKVQRRTMELEQLLQQERVLGAITQHIRGTLNLDDILSAAVTEVREVLQADRALIFKLTTSGSGVVIQESVLPAYPATLGMSFPEECFPEPCTAYYCQGQPRIVMDLVADEWGGCLAEFLQQVEVKTKIVAPIVQTREGGELMVWGLLIVHSCAYHRPWQDGEAALMQQISNQVAIALRQSELHEQLQNSETRFRSAFDNAVNGMAMISLEGRFIRVNLALCRLLGYPQPELLQLDISAIIHSDDLDHVRGKIRDLLAGRIPSLQIESSLKHKFGELRWGISSASIVRNPQGEPIHFVMQIQDMTERRALEQMKSEFISVVSHELRTPLTSIRGSLGLLVSGLLEHQPEVTKRMIEIAATESERMVRLVNDILDLERLETKKITLNYQWCRAEALIQQAIESIQAVAVDNGIKLEFSAPDLQVWADPDRMIQVLVNLLSNAVKFSNSDASIWVSARIQDDSGVRSLNQPDSFSFSPDGDMELTSHVLFQVVDQGKGIPNDQLELIFERFQQVNASDSRDKGGTGLGLAICRNIIHQHGGSIWAESTLGSGSTFYFTLPIP